MGISNMDIMERGTKAVEGFIPLPYSVVDKDLREATRRTGENIKADLLKRLAELEESYG